MRRALLLGLGLCWACGDVLLRPLDLLIGGLSGRADTLVVDVFPGSAGQTCSGVGLETVQGLEAPIQLTWERGQADRGFSVPPIEEEQVTIVAYSLAEGQPIQWGCRELKYADLETPEVQLQLSARVAP